MARPLPTLGECIDGMFPKSGSASSAPEQKNKGDGMRTERITLEVTHDLDARLSDWIVEVVDESLGLMESVRVVHEPKLAPDANADGEANHAAQAASGGGGQPRGWLTDDERGSIQHAATCAKSIWSYSLAQELENILARLSPPEVVLPTVFSISLLGDRLLVEAQVKDALAAAGVAVKEVGRD
jgi:hypothetical protein